MEPSTLAEEQVTELKQLKKDLKQNGASRDEVKAAVDTQFSEWGIEVPVLTEEQRQEIHQIMQEMRQETKVRIDAKFEEWGLEPPARMRPSRVSRKLHGISA